MIRQARPASRWAGRIGRTNHRHERQLRRQQREVSTPRWVALCEQLLRPQVVPARDLRDRPPRAPGSWRPFARPLLDAPLTPTQRPGDHIEPPNLTNLRVNPMVRSRHETISRRGLALSPITPLLGRWGSTSFTSRRGLKPIRLASGACAPSQSASAPGPARHLPSASNAPTPCSQATPQQRRIVRQDQSKPVVHDLHAWLVAQLEGLTPGPQRRGHLLTP